MSPQKILCNTLRLILLNLRLCVINVLLVTLYNIISTQPVNVYLLLFRKRLRPTLSAEKLKKSKFLKSKHKDFLLKIIMDHMNDF